MLARLPALLPEKLPGRVVFRHVKIVVIGVDLRAADLEVERVAEPRNHRVPRGIERYPGCEVVDVTTERTRPDALARTVGHLAVTIFVEGRGAIVERWDDLADADIHLRTVAGGDPRFASPNALR